MNETQKNAQLKLDAMNDDLLDILYDELKERFGRGYFGVNIRRHLSESINDPDSNEIAEYVLAWEAE